MSLLLAGRAGSRSGIGESTTGRGGGKVRGVLLFGRGRRGGARFFFRVIVEVPAGAVVAADLVLDGEDLFDLGRLAYEAFDEGCRATR
jgi:hypothetical protein